ncbi:MAG TPA: hypothetical protein P5538_03670 [Bacteroidales bacterium]|nr:hypothetical protein [Bacteroidales bacterium]HOL98636.1 hypothetical protein [Bacteroidales bacterium]HPD24094.1 hypothetical protein [Bacteroidales bacterium]HRS99332.1 hypothetical protein [Bacteroidales bacterium]HRT80023.1 hypothetical protein [Bacteroidales bacterium]
MKKNKYIFWLYFSVFTIVLIVVFSAIFLKNKHRELLYNSAVIILQAEQNELKNYFPEDTTKFFFHIESEIKKSEFCSEIKLIYFENERLDSDNYANLVKDILNCIYDNRMDFALVSHSFENVFNFASFEFESFANRNCHFEIQFIKEKNTGKIFRLINIHTLLDNYIDYFLKNDKKTRIDVRK